MINSDFSDKVSVSLEIFSVNFTYIPVKRPALEKCHPTPLHHIAFRSL